MGKGGHGGGGGGGGGHHGGGHHGDGSGCDREDEMLCRFFGGYCLEACCSLSFAVTHLGMPVHELIVNAKRTIILDLLCALVPPATLAVDAYAVPRGLTRGVTAVVGATTLAFLAQATMTCVIPAMPSIFERDTLQVRGGERSARRARGERLVLLTRRARNAQGRRAVSLALSCYATLTLVVLALAVLIGHLIIVAPGKAHRETRGCVYAWACLAVYQIAKTAVTDQVAGRLRGGRPAKSGADHAPLLARASREPGEDEFFAVDDRVTLHGFFDGMDKYNGREGVVVERPVYLRAGRLLYTVHLSGAPSPGDRVVLSASGKHVVVEAPAANMRKMTSKAADLESGVVGATPCDEEEEALPTEVGVVHEAPRDDPLENPIARSRREGREKYIKAHGKPPTIHVPWYIEFLCARRTDSSAPPEIPEVRRSPASEEEPLRSKA